jgi:hypothetical protein
MAYVDISGSNNIWSTSDTVQVYIRCRKKGETKERGELSKTYYDAQ